MIFFSPSDLKDVEKTALNLLRMENTDIKQKQDPVRYCDISDMCDAHVLVVLCIHAHKFFIN